MDLSPVSTPEKSGEAPCRQLELPALMKCVFITGAAGFIGSNLADRLLAEGKKVVGWDNFSTGQNQFLAGALKNSNFTLIKGDNLDLPALTKAMAGSDMIFHLAA